jgi:transketolase
MKLKYFQLIGKNLRKKILNTIFLKKKGHIGGSFSCIDIIISIYFSGVFNLKKKDFLKKQNDIFILSKGHAAIALYAVLDRLRFSKHYNLSFFNKNGKKLMEHPSPQNGLLGIEVETGSLGNGLGVGAGIAYANLNLNKKKTIILVGDGELYEGSNWEAMLACSNYKLSNLLLIVDRNYSITLDRTENVMKLDNLKKKIQAFGFQVFVLDGHNYYNLISKLKFFKNKKNSKPTCLICETKKGKGSFLLESDLKFHHGIPTHDEYNVILKELS